MIDGSWTSTAQFSGYEWVWLDSLRKVQLMATQNYIPRESALHSEMEALRWAMESMLQHCQNFRTDCKDLIAMINRDSQDLFPDFTIAHIQRAQNQISDFLAMTVRSFHRFLYFIGCSIPVWLPGPPQV